MQPVSVLDAFARKSCHDVGADRRTAQLKLLHEFTRFLRPRPMLEADAASLQAFLDARRAAGRHPNTLRKERTMVRSFFTWAWQNGYADADTLLSIRSVPTPADSTPLAQPSPYTSRELRDLWALLDQRWPKLAPHEADRWLRRFADGRSPYSRVRTHAIRLQLDAVVSLALSCGMRRGEIFRLSVDDAHYDNAYIVVRKNDTSTREVPFTAMARTALHAWIECRARIKPDHDLMWMNLWSQNTIQQAMTRHTFERLLRTYVGEGWTLGRLRDTCAVEWARAGLPLWHLRTILGHSAMRNTLPYIGAADRGDVERQLERLPEPLAKSIAA